MYTYIRMYLVVYIRHTYMGDIRAFFYSPKNTRRIKKIQKTVAPVCMCAQCTRQDYCSNVHFFQFSYYFITIVGIRFPCPSVFFVVSYNMPFTNSLTVQHLCIVRNFLSPFTFTTVIFSSTYSEIRHVILIRYVRVFCNILQKKLCVPFSGVTRR